MLCVLSCASGAGCRYRPARFADRSPVMAVSDDAPIPVPRSTTYDERAHMSDIYLRRPIFDVFEARDFPTGGDVSSTDEVPRSTWYVGDAGAERADDSGAPQPPFVPLDEDSSTVEGALVVRDGRGLRYELLADPPGHLGLRTGADVVSGRLLEALGYHTTHSRIVELPVRDVISGTHDSPAAHRLRAWLSSSATPASEFVRVSAWRWPPGIDVGMTPDFGRRSDDPNDVVDHQDRRTLRALETFGEWLGWSAFGVRSLRDVYVGRPGEGHLVHHVVGMARSLGTEDVTTEGPDDHSSFWMSLVTLGLAPRARQAAHATSFPSLGYLPADFTAGTYGVSPAYSPFVRATPADRYWAAKRLLSLEAEVMTSAIDAARLPADAAAYLHATLSKRRRLLLRDGMDGVTPTDVSATSGESVWLRDRAIEAGLEDAAHTGYEVAFLDDAGRTRAPPSRTAAIGAVTAISVPAFLEGLVVLRVRSVRRGFEARRACDVHVSMDRGQARVIGVRH